MSNYRILFSIPSQSHVGLATDELDGMNNLGHICQGFSFAGKDGYKSTVARAWIILKNAFNLALKARKFKPDVIYFNSRVELGPIVRDFVTIAIVNLIYGRRAKYFSKSHGSDLDVFENKSFFIKKIALPYLRKHISAWLFLSTEEKETVIAHRYLKAENVFVIKNIVRINQFIAQPDFKDKLNIPAQNKILLFVGRIIPEKGIYEVLQAFKQIHNQFNVSLIVIGDGTAFTEIKQFIADNNLGDKIITTGWITEEEAIPYYAGSDMLVFPTYFNEGFPMALFNSVASGLSIVTTQIRAATDYLQEPENCIWATAKDSSSVANAVKTLLMDEALCASMRIHNKEKSKLFSQEQVCSEIFEIVAIKLKR